MTFIMMWLWKSAFYIGWAVLVFFVIAAVSAPFSKEFGKSIKQRMGVMLIFATISYGLFLMTGFSYSRMMADQEYLANIESQRLQEIAKRQVADEQAKAADEVQKAKEKAEQRARDEASARDMGVSYAEYLNASAAENDAHSSCQVAVKQSAKWNGSSIDWIPKYSWRLSGNIIKITGHDVSLANGFGATRDVDYVCDYDMSTREATVIEVD